MAKWIYLWIGLASGYATVCATEKIKIKYRADQLEGVEKGEVTYKRLVGNVVFVHEDVTFKADYAQYYDEQHRLEAYDNIVVTAEDGSTITAKRLLYDTERKIARLDEEVMYQADTMACYTDQLYYAADEKRIYFFEGAKVIEGDHVLTSTAGYYEGNQHLAVFYNQVAVNSTEYTVQCDTLRYNTTDKTAEFQGPTCITHRSGDTLRTDVGGKYNTRTQMGTFRHANLETPDYWLTTDLLDTDQKKERYTATGNVKLVSKKHASTIVSDYGQYMQKKNEVLVYGRPLMQRVIDGDTLYLAADTLVMQEEALPNQDTDAVVFAFGNVQMYKSDLQGKADSMTYYHRDSTVHFHPNPIFWSYDNQITADTIRLVLQDEALHKMYMDRNAFLSAQDTLGHFNQLKGNHMVANFQANAIASIDIEGNGESLYFFVDDSARLVGMNHLRCGRIHLEIHKNKPSKISFFTQPVGIFYPAHKMEATHQELPAFAWRMAERPTLQEILARNRE